MCVCVGGTFNVSKPLAESCCRLRLDWIESSWLIRPRHGTPTLMNYSSPLALFWKISEREKNARAPPIRTSIVATFFAAAADQESHRTRQDKANNQRKTMQAFTVHVQALLLATLLASCCRLVVASSAFLAPPRPAFPRRTPNLRVALEYDDFLPQPNPSLAPSDVLSACMATLQSRRDAGLEVCFNFSSDRCRAAIGGSLEKFAEYATNPVFGYLVQCGDYEVLSVGPEITGTPTRGAMQTILMEAKQGEDRAIDEFSRRFLWTFQKERRPPRQNCWVIHEVIYVKNAYMLTL